MKIGSRKVLLAFFTLTLSAIALFLGKLPPDSWVTLVGLVTCPALAGLTLEHFFGKATKAT